MAWWNKRRQPQPSAVERILDYSDTDYVSFVAKFVDNMDPGTRAHTAVAYENLLPIVSAAYTINKERGFDFTIEGLLADMWSHIDDGDEIKKRRYSWFCFSALVARLEKIARRDQTIIPKAAATWTIMRPNIHASKLSFPKVSSGNPKRRSGLTFQ